MIQCPSCKASLPDWSQTCQFCKADVTKVARPVGSAPVEKGKTAPSWIWGAYYSLAGYFVLSGGYGIFQVFVASQQTFMGEKVGLSFFSFIAIAVSGLQALLGLGLMLKVEAARGVVNFFCGMQIIFGLFSLAGSVLGTMFSGAYGLILVIVTLLNIGTAGFMIYVIGETDSVAPNL